MGISRKIGISRDILMDINGYNYGLFGSWFKSFWWLNIVTWNRKICQVWRRFAKSWSAMVGLPVLGEPDGYGSIPIAYIPPFSYGFPMGFPTFFDVYQRPSARTPLDPPLRCRRFWSSISINWSRWSKPILRKTAFGDADVGESSKHPKKWSYR